MSRRAHDHQSGPDFFDGPEFVDVPDEAFDPDEREPEPESDGPGGSSRSARRLVVEADGGSRGNPGPAAYGALVRDADSGETLAAEGLTIGRATNNVAEYSGLIAGLEMARAVDAAAPVEVRMDSKLVIEQMAGRWKIKHPDMKPLAMRASQLRPRQVTWTWVPRAENKRADALVNSALDGTPVPRPESASTPG
jgi:ribonuclease HI